MRSKKSYNIASDANTFDLTENSAMSQDDAQMKQLLMLHRVEAQNFEQGWRKLGNG